MTTATLQPRQALFFVLMTAILAAGCSDSTGPTTDGVTNDPSGGQKGAPVVATPGTDEAPKMGLPVTGDSATPLLNPSFLKQTLEQRNGWATASGTVQVPAGTVSCAGYPLRYLYVDGIRVGRTGGPSNNLDQRVTAVIGVYRYNGTGWVLYNQRQTRVFMRGYWPPQLPVLETTLPVVDFYGSASGQTLTAGYYKITLRLNWEAYVPTMGRYVWTAQSTYDLNAQSEYYAVGNSRTYPGYCQIG